MDDPQPILSEAQVRRGLRINILAGALGMAWFAASQGVTITMFMEALEATGVQIGLVVTFQQLAMLVQIPVALYTESFTRRKPWWAVTAALHRALWLVPAMLPFVMFPGGGSIIWTLLATIAVSSLLAQASVPLWFSWLADLVPPKISGRFWGMRQSVVMAVFLVSTVVMGWTLDQFPDPRTEGGSFMGFAIVFGIGGLLGMADIFVHLRVPEPPLLRAPARPALLSRVLAPLRLRDFRRLTLVMGIWTFAIGVCGAFGMVYLKRDFDVGYIQLSFLAIGGSIGAVLAGLTLGKLIDRIGARSVGVLCLTVGPLCTLTWFFIENTTWNIPLPGEGVWVVPQPIALLFLGNIVAGLFFSGVGLCQLTLIGSLTPNTGRTMAMAVHWTLVGGMASLGPVVGGSLLDYFTEHPLPVFLPTGEPASFHHVQLAILMMSAWLCIPILRKVTIREGEMGLADALARILPGNPLRAVVILNGMISSIARRSRPAHRPRQPKENPDASSRDLP